MELIEICTWKSCSRWNQFKSVPGSLAASGTDLNWWPASFPVCRPNPTCPQVRLLYRICFLTPIHKSCVLWNLAHYKLSTDPHVKVSGLPEAIVKAREGILELLDTKVEWSVSSACICAGIDFFPFSLPYSSRGTGWPWRWTCPSRTTPTSLARGVATSSRWWTTRAATFTFRTLTATTIPTRAIRQV